MTVTLRSGNYSYEALDSWEQLPEGVRLLECPGVAVNSKDEVHVLTRNDKSEVLVFGPDGKFRRSFGRGVFSDFSHGIHIGPDDSIYCADVGSHTCRRPAIMSVVAVSSQ